MAEGLTEFLRAAMRRGFAWGEHDCALFCADRVRLATGREMAARWRGNYDTEAGAMAFVDGAGGLVELFDEAFGAVLDRCPAEASLIGVIEQDKGSTGAVRSGKYWTALTERGLARVRIDRCSCLAAWGV